MFGRKAPTTSDDPPPNGYGGVNTAQWLEDMPGGASLLVRRHGEYITALGVESCWNQYTNVLDLETTLLDQCGPGIYTVTPNYDGRLHKSARVAVGHPGDVADAQRARAQADRQKAMAKQWQKAEAAKQKQAAETAIAGKAQEKEEEKQREATEHGRKLEPLPQKAARRLTFSDRLGLPVAYLTADGAWIFLLDYTPVAFIYDDAVYTWSVEHIGWFQDGWLRDLSGDCVCSTEDAEGGPERPSGLVNPFSSVPHPGPVGSSSWSKLTVESFFKE